MVSCGGTYPAAFPVRGTDSALSGFSKNAAAGILDLSKPGKIEYRFDSAPRIESFSSLEIEYEFSHQIAAEEAAFQLVFAGGEQSWIVPADFSFLGLRSGNGAVFHYAIPVSGAGQFSITCVPAASGAGKRGGAPAQFRIRSLEFKRRWFGYYRSEAGYFAAPFVSSRRDGTPGFVIDPPADHGGGLLPELAAGLSPGSGALIEAGGKRFELVADSKNLRIPAGALPAGRVLISGDRIDSFRLTYSALPPVPAPITADPGIILEWPEERWRGSDYEVFRWESFPSLLIFDTADYAAQDRLFKRLAFFTEKAGFSGRLASDAEIAGLHGWNAHDYRADDLARFFETARAAQFPLRDDERALERILRDAGVIRQNGGRITPGEGGLISVSRESADYLRSRFMAHEGFHGLFFIDGEFRDFAEQRWEGLDARVKRFLLSYFDYQHYDVNNGYLMVNEFAAHVLQQPASQAGFYFGTTIASRLADSPRRRDVLPEKDAASGSWPEIAVTFNAEAAAFSAYVNRRWGLSAGRVWLVSVR